jgi:hypothetical protein
LHRTSGRGAVSASSRSLVRFAHFCTGQVRERAPRNGVIRQRGAYRGLNEMEFATLDRAWCFNHHHHLLEPSGYIPPIEYELAFLRHQELNSPLRHSDDDSSGNPGAVQSKPHGHSLTGCLRPARFRMVGTPSDAPAACPPGCWFLADSLPFRSNVIPDGQNHRTRRARQ